MMNKFLETKVNSESARKTYNTLFKRIGEYEEYYNKKIEKWSKEDCVHFLSNLGSKKYNTVAIKWSLLKKYLYYIGNDAYRYVTRENLESIEDTTVKYISFDRLFDAIEIFENNLDKALLLLMRSGIKGDEFSELTNLKREDIKGNCIHLSDRDVIVSDKVKEVVDGALKEVGYRMNVKKSEEEGKRIAYSYYKYNTESEYFWRNRPNRFNNLGLNPMKPSACKIKINNLISRIEDDEISTTSLTVSYVIDKILETERTLGISFSEKQTKAFIEKLGVKCSMYTVFVMKNQM